jgi:clan AA aspartic protease (TIGR02281 family)
MKRALLLALLGPALVGAQTASFESGKTSTTIQAQMVGRYFQFEVLVNGKPTKLILDTGAGLNVLTPQAAERLGIKGGLAIQAQGAGSQTTPAKLVTLDSFQVGDAVVKGDQAVVIELPEALQCDGLVGYSFIRHFATTFDYANAKLTFTDPKAFTPPSGAGSADLKIVGNHPRIMGALDGKDGWFTLDTGANGTLTVLTPFAETNKLAEKRGVTRPRIVGKGVGGFTMGYLATLGTLSLAGFEIPPVPSVLSTQKQGAFAATDAIGNVGAEILSRFVFTLDYVAKKAHFTKVADFDRPFRVDRSGAWIDFNKGEFKLAAVAPASPAEEAGLKAGDQIVAIDGTPLATVHPLSANRPLQQPAGTKVKITFKRAGDEKVIELTLRDLR